MNEIINNFEDKVPEVLDNIPVEAIADSGANVGKILLKVGGAATVIAAAVGIGKFIWGQYHKNEENDEPAEAEEAEPEEIVIEEE